MLSSIQLNSSTLAHIFIKKHTLRMNEEKNRDGKSLEMIFLGID